MDIWEWKMSQGSEVAACLSHKVAWLPDQDNDFWALVDGAGEECFWYCQKNILTSPENCTDDLWFFWSIIIILLNKMMLAISDLQTRLAILFQNQVDWLDDEAATFWGSWGIIVDFL